MTYTWADIQRTENDDEVNPFWATCTRAKLIQYRREFMQDARDSRRYGSYADAESYEADIAEIEAVLNSR